MRRARPADLFLAPLLAALAPAAGAHPGLPPAPHDLWSAWNLQPLLLASLALAGWLYARGFAAAQRRAAARANGAAAGRGGARGVRRWQAVCFAWALLALFVALVSPLDALGSSLLSAHMVQHLLLLVVAPALLVLSAPGYVTLWALPRTARKRLARAWNRSRWRAAWGALEAALFSPLGALLVSTAVLWAWHASALYQAALVNEAVHRLEHATFLASAYLLWSVLLAPLGRRRANGGVAAALLFGASVQGSALGALMAFAPTPWYPAYAATTADWGLTQLQDQQLAGVLMWMPLGAVYVLLACALLWRWLQDPGPLNAASASSRPPAGSAGAAPRAGWPNPGAATHPGAALLDPRTGGE